MGQTVDIKEVYRTAQKQFQDRSKHRVIRFKHKFKGKTYTNVTHVMEWQCAEYVKWIKSWKGVSELSIELAFDE